MEPNASSNLLSPEILVVILATFVICAIVGAAVAWIVAVLQRRKREQMLSQQRAHQEEALKRVLESLAHDRECSMEDYEQKLAEQREHMQALERENARLRDRLSSFGVLGLFGGKQREVVSALLLENEQLHELLATKQAQLSEIVGEMTSRLMAQLEQQAEESARAVRYKQALLSAFLQHAEARHLLDRMLAAGEVDASAAQRIDPPPPPDDTGPAA